MRLESTEIIEHPADEVFRLVRDDIDKLVPFLPNVERIEVVRREELEDGRVRIMNHWHAKADVPKLAKKFLKPEMFSWKDDALWKADEYCVEYTLETFWLSGLYDCSGTNYFLPVDERRTEIKVICDLKIHPEKIPGIPRFLAAKVLPAVEALIRKLLAPNLTSMASGIKGYFGERQKD